MGASNSHESLDGCTPPKPDKSLRILHIDPRSPSGDITRTPIVVDKTPEGMLDADLDPRSPTVGIARTPLTYISRSQTEEDYDATGPIPKMDLNQDLTDTSDLRPVDDTEGTDFLFGEASIQNINLDDFPTCESTRLVPNEAEQQPRLSVDTEKIRKKKKKPNTSQPKELFPLKKVSGLKDVTRSPLSTRNVDMNSPLSIVQRKQIKDVDLKRNCSHETGMSRFIVKDKENM